MWFSLWNLKQKNLRGLIFLSLCFVLSFWWKIVDLFSYFFTLPPCEQKTDLNKTPIFNAALSWKCLPGPNLSRWLEKINGDEPNELIRWFASDPEEKREFVLGLRCATDSGCVSRRRASRVKRAWACRIVWLVASFLLVAQTCQKFPVKVRPFLGFKAEAWSLEIKCLLKRWKTCWNIPFPGLYLSGITMHVVVEWDMIWECSRK